MANKYLKHAKINETKFRTLLRCFAYDASIRQAAGIAKVGEDTACRIYRSLRNRIKRIEAAKAQKDGIGDLKAEHFFLAAFVAGASGGGEGSRGSRQCIVMGVKPFRRHAGSGMYLHAKILAGPMGIGELGSCWNGKIDCDWKTVSREITDEYKIVVLDFIKGGDAYREYQDFRRNGSADPNGFDKTAAKRFLCHLRTDLRRKKGVSAESFDLHLGESAFKFNHPETKSMIDLLLKELRREPLKLSSSSAKNR